MATVTVSTVEDTLSILRRFEKEGPTPEERIAFIDTLTALMSSDIVAQDFQENLTKVAESVIAIDRAFNLIDSTFSDLAKFVYAIIYPELVGYYNDWNNLKTRWRTHLALSRTVANNTIALLKRFDTVYLNKVENIQTEQDRLDAIKALTEFIDEKQDQSTQMSQGFLQLKRDVAYFLERFDVWLTAKSFIPSIIVTIYKVNIEEFKRQIHELELLVSHAHIIEVHSVLFRLYEIENAKASLAIAGTSFYFFDLTFASSIASIIIFIYQAQRLVEALRTWQSALASWEQTPILQLKSRMDAWRPDLDLMCERLVFFAEIWSAIRSQSVQFRAHLQGGLDAATNMRFKAEVKLARSVCTPLADGLAKYAADLIQGLGI